MYYTQALTMAQQAAFDRQLREQLELAEAAELQKLHEAKQRALDQRDAQLEQLKDLKRMILAERAQDRMEVCIRVFCFRRHISYRIAANYSNRRVFQHWFEEGCGVTS